MKKFFLPAFLGMFLFVFSLQAAESAQPETSGWTPFQLGFFPRVPQYTYSSNVYGIKTGWPMCSGIGQVKGLEASWLLSGTDYIDGAQGSMVCSIGKKVNGLQASIVLCLNKTLVSGIQASCVFNCAGAVIGLQAGGLNIAGSMSGFQPGVLGNITGEMSGFQAGLYNVTGTLKGMQASAVNVAGDAQGGFQFGVVNVSGNGGCQFGLINIIKGGVLPVMILFNFD